MKRAATLVLVMLAMSASAAVDARALAREGQKTQWAPTRNFSSLNARAVFGGESRRATSPYAGEERETAAGEKDWQYAAGNPTRFVDSDGRDPAEISAREYSTIDFWSRAQIGPYAPFVDLSSGEARTPTPDYRRGLLSYPRDYEADPVNPLPVYDNRRVADRALFNTPVRLVQSVASLPPMVLLLGSPQGIAKLPEFQRGMDAMFSPLKVGYGVNADPEAISSAELFWDVETTLPFVVAPFIGAARAAPAMAGRLAPRSGALLPVVAGAERMATPGELAAVRAAAARNGLSISDSMVARAATGPALQTPASPFGVRQLDNNLLSALIDATDMQRAAALDAVSGRSGYLVVNRSVYREALAQYSKEQVKRAFDAYGITLQREIGLSELERVGQGIQSALSAYGRRVKPADSRVLASGYLTGEEIVTADKTLYYRALDLGLSVRFQGNAAAVQQYKRLSIRLGQYP